MQNFLFSVINHLRDLNPGQVNTQSKCFNVINTAYIVHNDGKETGGIRSFYPVAAINDHLINFYKTQTFY